MEFKVINAFKDKENDNIHYNVGETYPKGDKKVSKKRIEELSKKHPKHSVAFIAPVSLDNEDSDTVETDEEKALEKLKKMERKKLLKLN